MLSVKSAILANVPIETPHCGLIESRGDYTKLTDADYAKLARGAASFAQDPKLRSIIFDVREALPHSNPSRFIEAAKVLSRRMPTGFRMAWIYDTPTECQMKLLSQELNERRIVRSFATDSWRQATVFARADGVMDPAA